MARSAVCGASISRRQRSSACTYWLRIAAAAIRRRCSQLSRTPLANVVTASCVWMPASSGLLLGASVGALDSTHPAGRRRSSRCGCGGQRRTARAACGSARAAAGAGGEPVGVVAGLHVGAVRGDHLAGQRDELGAAAAGLAGALGDLDELADDVRPAQWLLEDVEEVIAGVAIGHDEPGRSPRRAVPWPPPGCAAGRCGSRPKARWRQPTAIAERPPTATSSRPHARPRRSGPSRAARPTGRPPRKSESAAVHALQWAVKESRGYA